ncbi:GntR family transcriptional regulator, partial [Kribbella catacumbae]|uniref:GntR family transcriptional regulator n=1 Tax=Kribbella catacumbae TaxID=460086 RepID=UPI0003757ADE
MPIQLDSRTIDRFAHSPKYRQLVDVLRAAIDDGRLQPGEELPSEDAMARDVGMSRDSVRKSLGILAAEGLILRRSGAGTFVATQPKKRQQSAARYRDAIAILERGGERPQTSAFVQDHGITWEQYRVEMTVTKEPATEKDAEYLAIKAGDPVLRRVFRKIADDEVVQLQRSAIPWDLIDDSEIGRDIQNPDRQPWPLGTFGEIWDLGWRIKRVVEDETARNPTDDERRQLEMET